MKKLISSLSILVLLFSGFVHAEQDRVSIEICKEGAKEDGVSSGMIKEYIDKCVKDIEEDEKKEEIEVNQDK